MSWKCAIVIVRVELLSFILFVFVFHSSLNPFDDFPNRLWTRKPAFPTIRFTDHNTNGLFLLKLQV